MLKLYYYFWVFDTLDLKFKRTLANYSLIRANYITLNLFVSNRRNKKLLVYKEISYIGPT